MMDRTFTLMSEDEEMGPKLRDADMPQRFEFRTSIWSSTSAPGGPTRAPTWPGSGPTTSTGSRRCRMTMSSETANKYFQGKENVAIAIARRRIKAGGDVKASLALIPITKPLYARYRR